MLARLLLGSTSRPSLFKAFRAPRPSLHVVGLRLPNMAMLADPSVLRMRPEVVGRQAVSAPALGNVFEDLNFRI